MPTLVGVAPRREMSDARLQHLIGMEACIFAQQRTRERGDYHLWRMTEREMPGDHPCGEIDLTLPVKGVEQSGTDCLRICRQIIEPITVLTRQVRRGHIKIASQIELHRAVKYAAYARRVTIDLGRPDPCKLVYGVGVGEIAVDLVDQFLQASAVLDGVVRLDGGGF
jgi:hypothetical protein